MGNSPTALIGYSGFVGSNILNQQPFDFLFNSKNIEEIKGKEFSLVVCAAAPGTKWKANKEPENDLLTITKLMKNLKNVKTEKFVLISTIDVYSPVNAVNEDTPINTNNLQPYGLHRRMLEEFVEANFNSLIIRLPGVFGKGLKKNPIFDLIAGDYDKIDPGATLQFYSLEHIWDDISTALKNNLKTLNIATEPTKLSELAKKVFSLELHKDSQSPAYYDMRTKHARFWGEEIPYLYLKEEIYEDLRNFISEFA